MMTVMDMVRRVTPPMNDAAPMSAKAPGSIHDQVLGGRKTPLGALQQPRGQIGLGGWWEGGSTVTPELSIYEVHLCNYHGRKRNYIKGQAPRCKSGRFPFPKDRQC
jgi:hypothetical protein